MTSLDEIPGSGYVGGILLYLIQIILRQRFLDYRGRLEAGNCDSAVTSVL